MRLDIGPDGDGRVVYGEAIDLSSLGSLRISRAGVVEPDADGRWWADMHAIGGPILGPFALRSEAIEAELAWLDRHWPPA